MRNALKVLAAFTIVLSALAVAEGTATAGSKWERCGSATWAPIYYFAKNVSCSEAYKVMRRSSGKPKPTTVRGFYCVDKTQSITGGWVVCRKGNQKVKLGYAE